MSGIVEQIAVLIKKEARRQNEEREKETKEYIRDQGKQFKEKVAHAVHDYKEQNTKTMRETVERYREQIQHLKREHKAVIAKLQKDNHIHACEIVEKVSSIYSIPMKNVRRDLAPENDTHCLGVRKNGKLCVNRAIRDGYCCLHINDPRPGTPIIMPNGPLRHNHPFPSGFVSGCPACEKSQTKEVREITSIM